MAIIHGVNGALQMNSSSNMPGHVFGNLQYERKATNGATDQVYFTIYQVEEIIVQLERERNMAVKELECRSICSCCGQRLPVK